MELQTVSMVTSQMNEDVPVQISGVQMEIAYLLVPGAIVQMSVEMGVMRWDAAHVVRHNSFVKTGCV